MRVNLRVKEEVVVWHQRGFDSVVTMPTCVPPCGHEVVNNGNDSRKMLVIVRNIYNNNILENNHILLELMI